MTLQVAFLIRRSSRKQHGTENNRSWLSTCSQVVRPWHLKVQHVKPCHTFKKLDVFSSKVRPWGGKSLSISRGLPALRTLVETIDRCINLQDYHRWQHNSNSQLKSLFFPFDYEQKFSNLWYCSTVLWSHCDFSTP